MNEERKEWSKQYYANFGLRQFLRLGSAILIWMSLAVVLVLTFNNTVFIGVFVVIMFVVAILALQWKPAYSIYRKILGNKNLPIEPMPRSTMKIPRQPLPWYGYLPGIWGWLMGLALLYAVMRYLSSK